MSLKNCTIKIHFIRTNRIQDDDVNHKGKNCKNKWREKNYFFLSYFWHISLWVHPNFEFGDLLDVEFNSTSSPYWHCILLRYPRHLKMKNSIKTRILILKSFWVPWVPQKYAVWVWVGWRTQFHIQQVPKLKIWVNQ